jgi:hypothetical protein
MRELKLVRELLTIAVLTIAISVLLVAGFAPEKYGAWLGKIDQGRYGHSECGEYYEHDYTLEP